MGCISVNLEYKSENGFGFEKRCAVLVIERPSGVLRCAQDDGKNKCRSKDNKYKYKAGPPLREG
jgi:hypothetical protein